MTPPREASFEPVGGAHSAGGDVPRQADVEPRRAAIPQVVDEVLRTPGAPLDGATRAWIEPRFGHDFGRVRIHADAEAAHSAAAVGAAAYTVGCDVVFGAGEHQPRTPRGRALLAHELAHVVQQEGVAAGPQSPVALGAADDAAEGVADRAVRLAMGHAPQRSIALGLRDALRASARAQPTLQRQVKTWGGEWDVDLYKKNIVGGVPVGVEIDLRFKPGDDVDATSIAMVQAANSIDTGKVVAVNPTAGARSIPVGERGEGIHIDQAEYNRSPLYAVEKAPAKDRSLTATAPTAFFGRHGFRFVDKAGNLHKRDAKLHDKTNLGAFGPNSSQTFETTAVAIAGEQVGTYYGSVRWGWRSDAANKFQRLPLTKGSDDVPSSRFTRAAGIFNRTKTSLGEDPLRLLVASRRFVADPDTPVVADPANPAATQIDKLAKGTRVEVTNKGWGKAFNKGKEKWWKVTAVEGTFIGKVGWVLSTTLTDKNP